MIRLVPNSCTSPVSTLKGWPASATSSPMRNTRGSRRISSAIASRTASPYVSSLAAPRPLDEAPHRRVDGLDVLAVDALGVDPQRPGARQDVAGDGLAARRVLAVEVVLAEVDDGEPPERRHVHHLVEQALPERAVAEEAHGDLVGAPHLCRQRGAR